jgi:hypothetical protein
MAIAVKETSWASVMSRMMIPAHHTGRHGSAQVVNGFRENRSLLMCAVGGRGCQGAGEFREQRQRVTKDGSAVATALWKRELARRQNRETPGL